MINGLSLLCGFSAALFLIWLGMLIERDWSATPETDYEAIRKAVEEREIKDAAERVKSQWVHVDETQEAQAVREDETKPPQSLLELEVEIQFAEVEG